MKIRLIILLLLFVFVPVEFAVCVPAQRTLYVPAVINENYSEMIPISVETVPGTGLAYISIGATIGPYTQESEEIAAKVAYTMVDIKECDILLRIDTSDSIRKIDGPSAGAAMTILMLSALKNEQLRQDFAITGTIEENGNIGSVGGIP
ncbi:MAG: S16 family serine protease, partial [Candidatus Micrarchaeia archaeon]